jgi:hypothetical protein
MDTEEIYHENVNWIGMAQHLVQWLVSREYSNDAVVQEKKSVARFL